MPTTVSPTVSSGWTTSAVTSAATTIDVTTTAWSVTIAVSTEIDAPGPLVWAVLTDTDAYPEWNPFVRSLRGALVVGERIEVELQLPGRRPRTIRPRITARDEGRSFEWLGRIGPRHIFDGRHRFDIRPNGPDSCVLVQHEHLSGLLVPAVRSLLTGPTPEGFAALNEALKARATDPHGHRAG